LIAVPVPAPVAIIVVFILILMTAPLALFPADHAQPHGVQVRLDAPRPNWVENYCTESPTMIAIGKESYFLTGDRQLMPVRKDQPPLRRKCASSGQIGCQRTPREMHWRGQLDGNSHKNVAKALA
jgi:hypothetical protein